LQQAQEIPALRIEALSAFRATNIAKISVGTDALTLCRPSIKGTKSGYLTLSRKKPKPNGIPQAALVAKAL
jgi:hypothetical protein